MLSLVYTSTATTPFDDGDLALLLMNSRANNRRIGLSGVLLHKDDQFLQLLEGADDVVEDRFARIAVDPRHTDVTVLHREQASAPRFPEWTMGYEAVTDTIADQIPGYRDLLRNPWPVWILPRR